MDVKKEFIYQFLEGSSKTFIIPVYQRDYAWKKEQCEKLWTDMLELQETGKASHFLGTIVNIYDNLDKRIIVDGQQRLTTVSLLLLALQHYLQKINNVKYNMLEQQLNEFLINKYSNDESKRIRLKPNKQDEKMFNQLFKEKKIEELQNATNIVNNYKFFYQKIKNNILEPEKLFKIFKKLEIVNIELASKQDDPQLIFESLNSTGVDLTDGDLIRNYILMDIEPETQEKLYFNYWVEIECLVANNVAEFVRHFLMFKLQKHITQSKRAPYLGFKKYVEEKQKNSEQILKELLYHAKIYSYLITQEKHPIANINHQLERLYHLEFSVSFPFLLEVFDLYQNDILDTETVSNIIKTIESYAFRKVFVTNTTQGLNKFFLTLSKEMENLAPNKEWKNKFLNVLNFIIKNKTATQKCPTDEEFLEALINKEVYKLRAKNKDFLLESLENYKSAYKVDLSDLTIEHIMPQKLTPKWKDSLGFDWEEIHKQYLHTLGNLTWTSKNAELSNKSYEEKKDIDLHLSKLKLSYKLSDYTIWNKEAILSRSKELAKEALQIWQYPQTSFEKPIEQSDIYILSDDDLDLTGTKPMSIVIAEKFTKIKHWRDVRKVLCEKFYTESPTEFNMMIKNSELKSYFTTTKENNLRESIEILPNTNIYVELHGSTQDIINFTKKITEYFDFDQNEIGFEIRK